MRTRSSADAGLISAALAGGTALCLECIARKTGVPVGDVGAVLVRIGKTLRIESRRAICSACLAARKVVRLG